MLPPCASTTARTMNRPSPRFLRPLPGPGSRPLLNGSNRWGSRSAGMGSPRLWTVRVQSFSPPRLSMVTGSSSGPYCRALEARFERPCSSRDASQRPLPSPSTRSRMSRPGWAAVALDPQPDVASRMGCLQLLDDAGRELVPVGRPAPHLDPAPQAHLGQVEQVADDRVHA